MIKKYDYLTFIPARSGSQSIKKKNIKKIGKNSLIEIAINFAKKFNPEMIELHSVCLNVPRLKESILKKIHKTVLCDPM